MWCVSLMFKVCCFLGYLDECAFVYLILCYGCIVICLLDSDCGSCSLSLVGF